MAEVYWIHLPEHTDMFKSGYIGFTTKTSKERYLEHKYRARMNKDNLLVCNAIRKHGERLILDTLCVCDNKYGLYLENALRHLPNVGWNLAAGGETPHNKGRVYKGKPLSEETKQKIAASLVGKPLQQDTKRKISEQLLAYYRTHPGSQTGKKQSLETRQKRGDKSKKYWERFIDKEWLSPTSNKEIWKYAHILFGEFISTGILKDVLPTGRRFNTTTIKRKFLSGWNPTEDSDFEVWLLSMEQYKEEE